MKKILIPAMMLAVGAAAVAVAAAPGDPVLMTVNGKDVPVSEFIYLYEKNNQQQQEPQSVDQYLDMFINYKLKVAAAEDAGVDTTAEFLKEYNGYANDLAAPYMRDTEAEEAVIANIKANSGRNVKVSHIMLPPGNNSEETRQYLAMLDTIRTQILDGADFSELVLRYSEDPSKVQNLGSMGWITVNRLPYPFEKVAFETPVGTISEPFLDAPFGTHIIRVEAERPDPGEVKVAHILKLNGRGPRRSVLDASKDSLSRVQIDSLYQLAINGADFFELARENSEDPGSAENGGIIDFFGAGRMVPEFEQTAFALKDGEISEPIKTEYGYHIIKRLEGRSHVDEETLDLTIRQRMARDHGLSNMLAKSFNDKNRARFNARLLPEGTKQVKEIIIQAGKYDSAVAAILTAAPIKLAQAGDRVITSAQVVAQMPGQTFDAIPGYNFFISEAEQVLDQTALDLYREALAQENPDYRNLINEYRDGSLLFTVSNENVWQRANDDREGREAFFQAHKDRYHFAAPKYKGYVVMAINDSVADLAKKFLADSNFVGDRVVLELNDRFGREINVSRVIAAKGENNIIDYIAFDGEMPESKSIWKVWFGNQGKIIDTPEEALDMRTEVTADYSKYLEEEWVKALRKKYKVKVNKKVLKSLEGK